MENKENRRKITYGTVALLCFLVLFGVTYYQPMQKQEKREKQVYKVVVLGDSIMGETRDETSIPDQLGKLLDVSVFNGALGGTCLGRYDREMRLGFTKDSLTVVAITEAIAANDFRPQQTTRIRESATEYFPETIDAMETIDYSKTDIFLICAGLNDYHAGTKIYSENDKYDQYTFAGAIRSSIRNIRRAYPDAKIVIVTPTYTWYRGDGLTCEEYDNGGGYLEKYVEAEIEVAAEMGVEVIDLYHDFYVHENWEDWEKYTTDGLHPNEAARTKIAEKIAEHLDYN